MQNILRLLKAMLGGVIKYKQLIPRGFVIGFTLLQTIYIGFSEGIRAGIESLAKTLLAAELIIQQNTTLAIQSDPTYTFWGLLQIINAVLVLYILAKIIYKFLMIGVAGGQAPVGMWILSILMLGLIEIAAVRIIEGVYFIPFWDGVVYMLLNLQPVLGNINWFSMATPEQPGAEELLNTTFYEQTSSA